MCKWVIECDGVGVKRQSKGSRCVSAGVELDACARAFVLCFLFFLGLGNLDVRFLFLSLFVFLMQEYLKKNNLIY
jgi:hypothetical protein